MMRQLFNVTQLRLQISVTHLINVIQLRLSLLLIRVILLRPLIGVLQPRQLSDV